MRELNSIEVMDVNGGVIIGPVMKFLGGWALGHALDFVIDHWDFVTSPKTAESVQQGASVSCRFPSPSQPPCGG